MFGRHRLAGELVGCYCARMKSKLVLISRSAVFAAAMLVVAGCRSSEPASDSAPLVGGFDAKHPLFDAIGAVVTVNQDGTATPVCTGTLVSPTTIVSSKECLLLFGAKNKLAFAVGYDMTAPRRVVPITSTEWERGRVKSGMAGVGADIAVGRLADAITDVVPIPVEAPTDKDVGQKLLTVGYGIYQTYPLPGLPQMHYGLRKAGTVNLRGREGRYWELKYGSYEHFKEAIADSYGTSEEDTESAAQQLWPTTLVPDYELLVMSDAGEATTCSGDEGAPLLRTNGNGWSVVAVYSAQDNLERISYPCLDPSAIYAAFGPEAQHLVNAADQCSGKTQRGGCEDGKATRCSRADEGPIRVTQSDCRGAGLTCSATPKEPVCAPACRNDADCNALAPGGACNVGTGECAYAPTCTDEVTWRSCGLCCIGQGAGDECFAACAALPDASHDGSDKVRGRSLR